MQRFLRISVFFFALHSDLVHRHCPCRVAKLIFGTAKSSLSGRNKLTKALLEADLDDCKESVISSRQRALFCGALL